MASNKYININATVSTDTVLKYLINENIFLTGPPGSGKTWITRQYIDYCLANYKISSIGITASTGIAAKLLSYSSDLNGITIHSWSGIDIVESHDTFESILKRVQSKPIHVKRWINTQVLIIDEISLLDSKIFMFLDMIGQHIRGNNKPFGGIRLLVVGDFHQLPPVNGLFCFNTSNNLWENTFEHMINLTTSYRSSDDNLNRILKRIRKGKELLPNMIKALKKRNSSKVLKTERYPILVPLRDMARNINNKKLKENTSTEYKFEAKYNKPELKSTIQKLSPLEDSLILKVGCPVIYLINEHTRGLVNGMVGRITNFINQKPVVLFNEREYIIDKHIWNKTDTTNQGSNNLSLSMEQFPLLLSYAITIHRSQGQTLSQASIVLDNRVWEKSQCYVALSRLQSLDGLNLLQFDPRVFNITRPSDTVVKKYYKKWKNNL
jgi:ATP-dependent DNA helicase PIF1